MLIEVYSTVQGTEFPEEEVVDSVCNDPDKTVDQQKCSMEKNEEVIELLKGNAMSLTVSHQDC